MTLISLCYPIEVRPWRLNQPWGVHRPDIYKQFGFEDHNGIDVPIGRDKTVRAEIDCTYYKQGWQPTGGGLYLSVLSTEELLFPDGKICYVLIDYLHLEAISALPGKTYTPGDALATQDNTGFSTGPHTHIQYRRVTKVPGGLVDVDKNLANNSFDPEPYRNKYYAKDTRSIIGILQSQVSLLTRLLELMRLNKK